MAVVVVAVLLAGVPAVATAGKRTGGTCPEEGPVAVALDPGHGGSDPGAVNTAYGLVEKDLTLDVAQRVAAILEAQGISAALTRTDNATALGNSPRGAIANACEARLYVSIHFNSVASPEPNYTKVFWGKKRKDEAFARHMHDALWPALHLDPAGAATNLTDGGATNFANGGLLTATMPSVLLESVFMSNPDEAARLLDTSETGRRQQIARVIADGIAGWLQ
jgi:N-acetylmuramoyl-L-alanine amidase